MSTVTVHKGTKINTQHNKRDGIALREKHIHPEGQEYLNEYGEHCVAHSEVFYHEDMQQACNRLFGDALREYNQKQKVKHPERMIDDYVKKIENTKDMHFAYELIYGVYPENGELIPEQTCREILKTVFDTFEERNPNFKLIGAYYHADEAGRPHLHIDYIPVGHNFKQGLKVQCSQNKALQEMGYTMQKADKDKGVKSEYAIVQWERSEREYLINLAKKFNVEARLINADKKHVADKQLFIAERKAEQAQKELHKADLIINSKDSKIKKLDEKIENKKSKLKQTKKTVKISSVEYAQRALDRSSIELDRQKLNALKTQIDAQKRDMEFKEAKLETQTKAAEQTIAIARQEQRKAQALINNQAELERQADDRAAERYRVKFNHVEQLEKEYTQKINELNALIFELEEEREQLEQEQDEDDLEW